MATQLKNILVVNLDPQAQTVLTHGLDNGTIPVRPDAVWIPSPDLEVVATTTTTITIRNNGPLTVQGFILVEHWHTIERAFGDVAIEELTPQPYIFVGSEIANQPAQPAFQDPPVEIIIYARLTGSDATGAGTLANPYRTFQRAVRDVPSFIPPGVFYIVDITGIGVETLPDDFALPSWKSTFSSFGFDLSVAPFHTIGAVRIRAELQPFSGIPLAQQTINAGVDSFSAVGLLTITDATKAWPVGGLVGQFAVGSGPFERGPIYANTATSISIAVAFGFPFTYPVQIMELSATLEGPLTNLDPGGAIQAGNQDSLTWQGIKIRSTDLDGTGVNVAGGTSVFDTCDLESMRYGNPDSEASEIFGCNLYDPSLTGQIQLIASRVASKGAGGTPGGSFDGTTFIDIFEGGVIDGCNPMGSPGPLLMANVLVMNALESGVIGGGAGGTSILDTVEINDSVDDGILIVGNKYLECLAVTGTGNGGVGIHVDSGAQVMADFDAAAGPTDVTGADDQQVGSLAAGAYPAAPASINDWTYDPTLGAPTQVTGTGARLFTP